jgi:hypothetical protein
MGSGASFITVLCAAICLAGARDCKYLGKAYPEGTTIVGRGILYKCAMNGRIAVIGCVTKSKVKVPKGQIVFADGHRYRCTGFSNLHYLEHLKCRESTCKAEMMFETKKGRKFSAGGSTSVQSTSGVSRSVSGPGIKVVHRKMTASNNTILATGTKTVKPDTARRLVNNPSGASSFRSRLVEDQMCRKNGNEYAAGEQFVANGFKFRCESLGAYTIIACVSPNGNVVIPLNTVKTDCGWRRDCKKFKGRATLSESYNPAENQCNNRNNTKLRVIPGGGVVSGIQIFTRHNGQLTSAVPRSKISTTISNTSSAAGALIGRVPNSQISFSPRFSHAVVSAQQFNQGCYNNQFQKVAEGHNWQRGIKQYQCVGGKAVLKGCVRQGGFFVPLNGEKSISSTMVAYCKMSRSGGVVYGEKPKSA